MCENPIDIIEHVITIDPGHRGIDTMWQYGSLQKAADSILKQDRKIPSYVLTGFCCMFGRCETDGPLGSAILSSTLRDLRFNTFLLTDSFAEPVVKAAASEVFAENALFNENKEKLVVSVDDPTKIVNISFIISIERPGRSRKTNDYRTMSARDITQCTAPLDLLFPQIGESQKSYLTIGVGDGGNEVGTGNIADEVCKHVNHGDEICTSICADILIMTGVSNWGALALAAALVIVANDKTAAEKFINQCINQPNILKKMIDAGSFDGCTGKPELSIDNMKYEDDHLIVTNKIIAAVKMAFQMS
ncbi:hypothetical protein TRFO_30078 [Tritrichomonas foetus]|uniref:D-glutamate cyclase-like C-terminal domain-containing protein n=1 Tax=Tritrichomonas foetus TaxID=1144522 RepID=A0A1J4JU91_9EUKA|nr:hypothetical protein TRFO_30078 [Tritrichomonas foetus]|eukprot:OHT02719.1 hypothetical protein TRFO_30078 [Tritrichomonas foetus]